VHGASVAINSFVDPILLVALTENMDGGHNIFAGDSSPTPLEVAPTRLAWPARRCLPVQTAFDRLDQPELATLRDAARSLRLLRNALVVFRQDRFRQA
jgi:hypothetical protein